MEVEINPNVNDIIAEETEATRRSKKRLISEQSATDESAPQKKLLKTDVRKVPVPLHRFVELGKLIRSIFIVIIPLSELLR
jgi:hypothetical protein